MLLVKNLKQKSPIPAKMATITNTIIVLPHLLIFLNLASWCRVLPFKLRSIRSLTSMKLPVTVLTSSEKRLIVLASLDSVSYTVASVLIK
jgi:hypothetical protein